jgi:hypothetical protein
MLKREVHKKTGQRKRTSEGGFALAASNRMDCGLVWQPADGSLSAIEYCRLKIEYLWNCVYFLFFAFCISGGGKNAG